MTKRERKVLGEYVRWVANEMGLRDWELLLMKEPPEDEDAIASVHAPTGQRRAKLWFCDEFPERDAEEQRDTVVHELVHCHLECAWDQTRDLCGQLGGSAYSVFSATYRRNMEYAIDGLSRAIAKHLPLIDWPTK